MNWVYTSATEQLDALSKAIVSAEELLEATISHAERVGPILNPFALTLFDRARKAAVEADRLIAKGEGGPLCGLPITIKDSQWLAGYPCANGSRTLQNFIPDQTCMAVELLEQAGAVIFAKTTCPEFSLTGITESEISGRTVNPWNHGCTPGGSSGGAAVSIAAGLGSLSLGGDGGGSIRIPAAFCGIVGFKPSFGVVPMGPGFKTWQSIVSYGPLARTVSDASLMFDVLSNNIDESGPNGRSDPDGIKIIVSEDLGFAPLGSDVRAAFSETVKTLEAAGVKCVSDHPGLESSVSTWAVTATYDMWTHKKSTLEDFGEIGQRARDFIEFGATFTQSDFDHAQSQRDAIHDAYMSLFESTGASIIITPTLGCEAFPHGTIHPARIGDTDIEFPWLDWAGFLYDANLAGMPACAIPMGIGNRGLPVSLQIMGPPGHDLEVLNVAHKIEELINWQHPEFHQGSPNSV